jgi:hypothetical protein
MNVANPQQSKEHLQNNKKESAPLRENLTMARFYKDLRSF